jgi:hypothetical protein
MKERSPAATSVFAFGVYLAVLGPVLILVPNLLLATFQIPTTTEPWVRVMGLLISFFGYFYIHAGRAGLRSFFQWSVHVRLLVFPFFAALVLTGQAPVTLLPFGAADLAGAVWTLLALRKEGAPA